MQVLIELRLEANIPKDRANANEIFLEGSTGKNQGQKIRVTKKSGSHPKY